MLKMSKDKANLIPFIAFADVLSAVSLGKQYKCPETAAESNARTILL